MFTDPLKESLTTSAKSFSKTIGSALWEPLLAMKDTFQKSIRSKPTADALARAEIAVQRQRMLEHLEAIVTTSLCQVAHKKVYKQYLITTGWEQFAQYTSFAEAAEAFGEHIPAIVTFRKLDLSAQDMKQAALLVEKLQEKITTFAGSYTTKTLSDNAGAFGETFASEVVQRQTAKKLHDLRDTYIQQAKQLLTTQEALLDLFRGTAGAQVKSQQAQIKVRMDEVIKQVQTITSLGKELTMTEKNFFDQFYAWMQKTMRGSKQYQKSIPDLQHNYLQASHKVNDQRDHVQQARLSELQSWGTRSLGETALPLEQHIAKEASFWLQWSSLTGYALGLEAQAYTFEMQLAHGWLSLLDQQQEVLHSIHAHTKAYALIASLLSHIKKQHLHLSEELLKVLIERKIIHHDTKIETWIDRAQRVHTALQQNTRDDERSSAQRKDLLQTLVLEEGRIPSLKNYLSRVHEYALALWGQKIITTHISSLNNQQQLFPQCIVAIQKLQGYLTNKLQLIHLQRDDAEKTYTMKPSAEQEKTLHDLDQQYTRHMQEASLLEHLHAHAVLEKENSDYLLHIYQIQAKQKKLQIKKIGSQIKKLLPTIKKLIANYPGFPVLTKDILS